MGRRLVPLTLDNLQDLPRRCRSCVFWELDPVSGEAAVKAGTSATEKEAWISAVLLEWGSCGRVVYVDEVPVGFVLYAPPAYVPRATAFPTSPVSPDAVQLITGWIMPGYQGQGLGRVMVQTVAKDLLRRGSARSRPSETHDGRGRPACCRPTISWPWASRPYVLIRPIPGCGWSCGRPCPGRKTSSWLWTGCWAAPERSRRYGRSDGVRGTGPPPARGRARFT